MFLINYEKEGALEGFNSQSIHGNSANVLVMVPFNFFFLFFFQFELYSILMQLIISCQKTPEELAFISSEVV